MQAVILAAGFGSRLGKMSGGLPKCLLEVGGRTLIEHQLDALSDAGVGKVLVIVGHQADMVRELLGDRVDYIENKIYAETNSLYSLWLARDWVKGSFILMNCDLLFHPSILDRLIARRGNALVFDSTSSKGQEQTKVAVQEGKLVDLGKDLPPEMARGESLGLLRFNERGAEALFKRADALIKNGAEKSWVIEAIRGVCNDEDIKAINIAGEPWTEIDFPNDLEIARREVWPAIHKMKWKKTIHWRKTKYMIFLILLVAVAIGGLSIGHYSPFGKKKTVTWQSEEPFQAREVFLKFPTGRQKWWVGSKEESLNVLLNGPTPVKVEVRLLMDTNSEKPQRYVTSILIDDEPYSWESFKATPDQDASLEGYVVGDKDKIKFDLPPGAHTLEVGLLAGHSDSFIGRISYPESVDQDRPDEEGNSDD